MKGNSIFLPNFDAIESLKRSADHSYYIYESELSLKLSL
jgi:hypothetical protein